ncbi:hypothetical protein SD71_06675 [Cohnella kolymensis]|uniref:Dynamin N-terminal domain-containing protein n=1 Tax=Cohnella kolymensis TaxID=1590652 RepID=A0ABR5A6Q6_9BACL|nr:dynamin family protein [Cohnella kolymensis]KIL36681.1 hypothetical protein SD71_06675 [Cohnella kolymensis]
MSLKPIRQGSADTAHPLLREFIKLHPIPDECVRFVEDATIISEQWFGEDSVKGIFFASDYRCGVITKSNEGALVYYTAPYTHIRYFAISGERGFQLSFCTPDHYTDPSHDIDLEITLTAGTRFEQVLNCVLKERVCTTHPYVAKDLPEVYRLIYQGRFESALSKLRQLKDLDPISATVHVMTARTYAAWGRRAKAISYAAHELRLAWYVVPELLLFEFIWYDWHPGAIGDLIDPDQLDDDDDRIMHELAQAAKAKHSGNMDVFVRRVCQAATMWMNRKDPADWLDWLPFTFVGNLFNYLNKSTEASIRQVCTAFEADFIAKLDPAADPEVAAHLKQIVRLFVSLTEHGETPDYLERISQIYDMGGLQLEKDIFQESFDSLKSASYIKKELPPIDYLGLEVFIGDEDTDASAWKLSHPGQISKYGVARLFAELRTEREKRPNKAALDQLLRDKSEDWLHGLDEHGLAFILLLIEAEVLIRDGFERDALKRLHIWRRKKAHLLGTYFDPYLRFGDQILRFYEAWALRNIDDLREASAGVPDVHPFVWLHDLGREIAAEWTSQKTGAAVDVMEEMKAVIRHAQRLSTSTELTAGTLDRTEAFHQGLQRSFDEVAASKEAESDTQEIRIAVTGEFSAGKSTLLNALFGTNLFFATQEEATGVPAEVRFGEQIRIEVLDRSAAVRSRLEVPASWMMPDGTTLQEGRLEQVVQFVADHTRVGAAALQWVERIAVYWPLAGLPHNAVLIDTPGFNAGTGRTAIADRVLKSAHICLYIMDARQALKGKEMDTLRMIREEAGKSFIVLNKADLILGDDELDCDGADSLDATVGRVRDDLSQQFGVEELLLYPVCSLPKEQVPAEAVRYSEALRSLMEKVFREARDQQLDLVIDAAAKSSLSVFRTVEESITNRIAEGDRELSELEKAIPADMSIYEDRIEELLQEVLYAHRSTFIRNMDETIGKTFNDSADAFAVWLRGISSAGELKNKVQNRAESQLQSALHTIEQARNRELERMGRQMTQDVGDFIQGLYRSLPFKVEVDTSDWLRRLPTLKLAGSGRMGSGLGSIDYGGISGGAITVGAIAGAFVLGPIGAVVGGFLGQLFGGKSVDEVKSEVYQPS